MTTYSEPISERTDVTVPPDASPLTNNFNFMRLCLAVLVILSHSFELVDGNRDREPLTELFHTLSFGELAVDGFFILSGYLIVKSWDRKPVLLDFLKKRVYKIYPGFIVASLICVFIVGPLGSDASTYFSQLNITHDLTHMLFLNMPKVPPIFAGLPYTMVNGSMWTISLEFRCYLAVAILGLAGAIRNRWAWLAMAALVMVVSLLPSPLAVRFEGGHIAKFMFGQPESFFRLFALYLAGGAFYLFRSKIKYEPRLILFAGIITLAGMFNRETAQLALATLGAYAFFGIGFKHIRGLHWHRSWPDISYGVYLYGWPCTILLLWYIRSITPYLLFPCAVILAAGCGWLSWRWVESPFMKKKPD